MTINVNLLSVCRHSESPVSQNISIEVSDIFKSNDHAIVCYRDLLIPFQTTPLGTQGANENDASNTTTCIHDGKQLLHLRDLLSVRRVDNGI